MKTIILSQITLTNFKGIRNLSAKFYRKEATISGSNGLGKTTVFDAFTWLLFGKDSHDRKTFDIKTLDENGQAIPQIPHEVSAIIEVDGTETELRRTYTEKWTKRRGTTDVIFEGHKEERFFNGIPVSLKEWQTKIDAICQEATFKLITNPKCFVSLKADVQRKMLFDMAGNVSDEELTEGNEDFKALLASLNGKTLDELKREIAAKKRKLKELIDAIPQRIDERERDNAAINASDFPQQEAELKDAQNQLAKCEEMMFDITKRNDEETQRRAALSAKLATLTQEKAKIESDVRIVVTRDYYEAKGKIDSAKLSLDVVSKDIQRINKEMAEYEALIDGCKAKRETLLNEWRTINQEQLSFNPDAFICPTCKRPLEPGDIEAKEAELQANFNARKSERLAENNANGRKNKEDWDAYTTHIDRLKEQLTAQQDRVEKLIVFIQDNNVANEAPDATAAIEGNEQYQACIAAIADTQKLLNEEPKSFDGDDMVRENIATLRGNIERLKVSLAQKDVLSRNNKRIEELREEHTANAQQLASLEQTEFTIAAFNKTRTEAVEQRVNSLFSLVRFKMYDQQINGGEVETCEATVNGVPYSSLNSAMKINAGLDIINAICRHCGVLAPIFIDNAESVNNILDIPAQTIRLVVSNEKTLNVH